MPASSSAQSPDAPADVAVIILTFNEEGNLPAALDSVVGWAREIFVVDSYSTDRTVDVALDYAAKGHPVQIVQHAFEDYAKQWNWSLKRLPIQAAWTLKLDADERATPPFRDETRSLFESAEAEADVEGVVFRRTIVFMGRRIRFGGTQGNYDLRLWRSGKAIFEDRAVNEHAQVQGKVVRVKSVVDHCTTKDLTDWLDKHNRYTSLEAQCHLEGKSVVGVKPRLFGRPDQRRAWLHRLYYHLPLRFQLPLVRFVYLYVFRLGFLDGSIGWHYCVLRGMVRYLIDLKVYEARHTQEEPRVTWPVRGTLDPRVADTNLQRRVDGDEATKADP